MNDKELLELAAKAAGYIINFNDYMVSSTEIEYWIEDSGRGRYWNPITDDGDALRLAVKLRLSFEADAPIQIGFYPGIGGDYKSGCEAWIVDKEGNTKQAQEVYGADPDADTRRAIVRAAAEIGKAVGS